MFDLVLVWLRCDMGLSENRVPIHPHFGHYMLNPFLAMITRCNNMTQNGIWHCVLQGILHQLVDGKHPSKIPLFTMFHRNPLTPTIYTRPIFHGYVRGIHPQFLCLYMVQYLHFRILEFPLIWLVLRETLSHRHIIHIPIIDIIPSTIISFRVNCNDLTATSLASWLIRENHAQMTLIQVSELF